VEELVRGAWLVRAANTLAADLLGTDPGEAGGRRMVFVSGDHQPAKVAVVELFDAAGFFPVDLVAGCGFEQFGGPLAGHNLVRLPPSGP
jgi:8-hydroxy-5-deazaflavin:NADPH oxidoreductase